MGYKWRYLGVWQWIFLILEEYLNELKMMELPQSSKKSF